MNTDFTRSDKLTAKVWKLPDQQLGILIEFVLNKYYGAKEFNDILETALNSMKTPSAERLTNPESVRGLLLKRLDENIKVRCPQCGQSCSRMDVTKDIFECPNCILQFEAVISISWDSKLYTRKKES